MSNPVLTCTAYDTSTGVCAVESWVEPVTFLPELSWEDGQQIAYALALAATVAFLLRWLRKQSESL